MAERSQFPEADANTRAGVRDPGEFPLLAAYVARMHDDAGERADARRHREAIMAAAREMLQDEGIYQTTMKDIAQRVGIGQGTLYRKFPTKAYLAGALLSEALFEVDAELQRRRGAGEPPARLLGWFVGRLAAFVGANADLLSTSMVKENKRPNWYEETAPVLWIIDVLARLFLAAGAAGTPEEARERALLMLPQFLFPGDVSAPEQRAAYQARVRRLLELLLAAG